MRIVDPYANLYIYIDRYPQKAFLIVISAPATYSSPLSSQSPTWQFISILHKYVYGDEDGFQGERSPHLSIHPSV